MIDNGRLRMKSYQGILYCEAYMDDEFSLDDLASMINEIRKNYNSYSDVILKKVGTYSVALDAQLKLSRKVKEFRNFVYLVNSDVKKASAEYAAASYMNPYNTRVATTIEDAFTMLSEIANG